MPTVIITLDFTNPSVVADPAGSSYQSLPAVTLTASEPATIYYTTDNTPPVIGSGSTMSGSSPVVVNFTPGNLVNRLRFFAVDLAGNSSGEVIETYFVKPLNTTVKTRYGPLVKPNAVDELANINDVTVFVDGSPVTVTGIRPLHNEIFLQSPPAAGSTVTVDYCWFDDPQYQIILGDIDHVLNAGPLQNVTDVPYQLVLNCPIDLQPATVTWEYTALERRYTAGLNSPELLLLNERVHEIKDPITGRPTDPTFVLNYSNTVFSAEQVKSDADPTVLNEGTPIYPLRQNDFPTFSTVTLPASDFQDDPDLWRNYDVLVPDGDNVIAFTKVTDEGDYICLETESVTDGDENLLTAACERLTETSITGYEEQYQFPKDNCGFISLNPPPATSGQLNSCFVLNGTQAKQFKISCSGDFFDEYTSGSLVDGFQNFAVGESDVYACVDEEAFILNNYRVVGGAFVQVGSYTNDATVFGGAFQDPGSYLQDFLECPNDEANTVFITGFMGTTGGFTLVPFTNQFVILP